MRHFTRYRVVSFVLTGVFVAVGAMVGSNIAGASPKPTRPPAPDTSVARDMVLIGADGNPIVGKNGEPIRIKVGGPIPLPASPMEVYGPGAAAEPNPEQAKAAAATEPITVELPQESDEAKARRLAPEQAKP